MLQLRTWRWLVLFVSLLVLLNIRGVTAYAAENVFTEPAPTAAERAKAGFEAACHTAADKSDKTIDAARGVYAAELKAVLEKSTGNADEIGRLRAEIDAASTGEPNSDKPRNPVAVAALRKFARAYTTASEECRRSQEAAKRQYLADLSATLTAVTKANDTDAVTQLKADLDRLRKESLDVTLGQDVTHPDKPATPAATRGSVTVDSGQGLRCELFNGENFDKRIAERFDPQIDFWWSSGSPAKGVDPNYFSIRWSGFIRSPKAGQYKFILQGDDGFRLKLDGQVVIDMWKGQADAHQQAMVQLTGRPQAIEVEFFDRRWDAQLILLWQSPGDKQESVIPEQY